MTTDIAKQWEAALLALDADHDRRATALANEALPDYAFLPALREINELRRLIYDAMHDYYYAGVWK